MKILEEAKLEEDDLPPQKSDKEVPYASGAGNESGILTIGCIGQPNGMF